MIARSGATTVALLGHLAVLFALGYESASEAVLSEPPAAIMVEIVFAPSGYTTMVSHQQVSVDDQSREPVDAIDRRQTAGVEQQDEPLPLPLSAVATAAPTSTKTPTPGRSSPTPKAIPGSTHVVRLSGTAHMTADEAVRGQFKVQEKTPALAIWMEDLNITMSESSALVRAHLWPVTGRPADIEPAKVFTEHIKLNKTSGLGARLTSAALSAPGVTGLLKKGLEKGYKDNLY